MNQFFNYRKQLSKINEVIKPFGAPDYGAGVRHDMSSPEETEFIIKFENILIV